ncbi:MoaD/ThiS family protein [Wenyingzhuangia sp. chi5]|uniref:Molybdopterin synthase sulfur carrier subunit n=1 Tax=Wenyingzhuangia gilva TaxID=3057677 RepID=A0ABT8VNM0_9FLAO|nr:MoaD/ThiS family protein [Wenyingzhuangia sp. chi5]MDO3693561.1 MoaD/ThiS family protein [Wenyingzhuangia sp. chi5]
MLVTIKYFGQLVEITNKTQESFSVETDTCNLENIEKAILNKYPNLNNTTYNIAVNQKIENKTFSVKEGDELAFLPPFAGG